MFVSSLAVAHRTETEAVRPGRARAPTTKKHHFKSTDGVSGPPSGHSLMRRGDCLGVPHFRVARQDGCPDRQP